MSSSSSRQRSQELDFGDYGADVMGIFFTLVAQIASLFLLGAYGDKPVEQKTSIGVLEVSCILVFSFSITLYLVARGMPIGLAFGKPSVAPPFGIRYFRSFLDLTIPAYILLSYVAFKCPLGDVFGVVWIMCWLFGSPLGLIMLEEMYYDEAAEKLEYFRTAFYYYIFIFPFVMVFNILVGGCLMVAKAYRACANSAADSFKPTKCQECANCSHQNSSPTGYGAVGKGDTV